MKITEGWGVMFACSPPPHYPGKGSGARARGRDGTERAAPRHGTHSLVSGGILGKELNFFNSDSIKQQSGDKTKHGEKISAIQGAVSGLENSLFGLIPSERTLAMRAVCSFLCSPQACPTDGF